MIKHSFDAALDFPAKTLGSPGEGCMILLGVRTGASFAPYKIARKSGSYALVTPVRPAAAKWMDPFDVLTAAGRPAGHGVVLHPAAFEGEDVKPARRKELLERLSSGEREMVLVLAELKGIRGLTEDEVMGFSRLDRARVEALVRGLEEEGKVRILSFAPLFLVYQESLDFLRRRIAAYLLQYHKKHPGRAGAPLEMVEKRFAVAPNILRLALRSLAKEGRVSLEGGLAALVGFKAPLSAADEKTLAEMERMFLKGEFGQVSLDEIRRHFRLTPGKLQSLLSVLMERKTIVEGRDGFILHSRWLEDVVEKIHGSGKRELTVADFKAMTGLTRKFAIPLLELLDEMGVTRRKGAVRDILK
jgi:selenocysteine-specific elongation factor